MTRVVSNNDMTNIRQSLAQAGIYFDKLYINQAYFNSNFTIQTSEKKSKRSKNNFWQKLLCGSKIKQSSTATQTVLTVRDDAELKPPPPPIIRRQQMPPTENTYDRRRYRPLNREYNTHNNYQQTLRRRRSSFVTRSIQVQKQINNDDNDDEFAV